MEICKDCVLKNYEETVEKLDNYTNTSRKVVRFGKWASDDFVCQ